MKKVDKFYKRKAEEMVDVIFDKGYFHPDISRKEMRVIEDLLGYLIQLHVDSAIKCHELTKKFKGADNG